jgi:hypothetical protein
VTQHSRVGTRSRMKDRRYATFLWIGGRTEYHQAGADHIRRCAEPVHPGESVFALGKHGVEIEVLHLLVLRQGDVERLLVVKAPGGFGGDFEEWRCSARRFGRERDRADIRVRQPPGAPRGRNDQRSLRRLRAGYSGRTAGRAGFSPPQAISWQDRRSPRYAKYSGARRRRARPRKVLFRRNRLRRCPLPGCR